MCRLESWTAHFERASFHKNVKIIIFTVMNKLKWIIVPLALLALLCGCSRSGDVRISNSKASISFDRQTGKLISFVDKTNSTELIDPSAVNGLPWSLSPSESVDDKEFKVSIKKRVRDRVEITWKGPGESPLEVHIDVSLEKDRPMSHWRASFSGLKSTGGSRVVCPVVSGLKPYPNADLAMPSWLGNLIHDPTGNATPEKPAVYNQDYPGGSSQLVTLYDRESRKSGLYLSSQDTESMAKSLTVSLTRDHVAVKASCLIPDKSEADTFSPDYDVVVGAFDGDWMDAAGIYREWAIRQKFCEESRFHNGNVPEWLPKTAFWIWNRGRSSNVLKEAEDIQERLGLPVNAYWHWWHGSPYDEGFPDYIPPKEGEESFMEAVGHARDRGIHSLVYMNSYQWGDSRESFKSEGAGPYVARREDGGTYRHVFNVFSGKGLTPMCMATQFWRDKYTSLCDTVVNKYGVRGVYMDQACMSMACYDPAHGHTLGGGNYWWDGFRKLTGQIRDTFGPGSDAMLAGEGSAEDWIPLLDDFLTLDPSRERYAGIGNSEPIPFFQAIYHDYAMTYGSYSSLVFPPYDELWPKEFSPANAETLLPEEFNMQFMMEQARAFTWGMQPTLANYHSFLFDERKDEMDYLVDIIKTRYNALDYLLYGELRELPDLPCEEMTIPISRVSIYAGRLGSTVTRAEKKVKTLYSSVWLSKGGDAGIALSNISGEPSEVSLKVDSKKYGIPSSGKVNLITAEGKKPLGEYVDGGQIRYSVPPRSNAVLELTK